MNDPIQEIKDRADIVELISEIIPVKRSGANYVSLCPFHNDTKPSMHISPSKGIFKCFSCSTGGDVFKFWSEYYQKDFKETLKDLANKYGVELNYAHENKAETEKFNLKIRMHQVAAEYYYDQLMGSAEAESTRAYISDRQISTPSINEFRLGFAPADPNNWGKLISVLKDKLSVSDSEIESAGLAIKSEKTQQYFDRFRGKLMIPIIDERSRVIAFGSRLIPGFGDENGAKYINSPDTEIYHKGDNLFGVNLTKESIRKEDAVILVEGFFDLISLYQAGIKNVVANQGTALTSKQAKILAKYTNSKRLFLCFDSDQAGHKALERGVEIIESVLNAYDHEIRVISIPEGKDADEFVKNHGAEAFRELMQQAPLLIDYKIQEATTKMEKDSPQAKVKILKYLTKYLSYIKSPIELSEYASQLSAKLNIDEYTLKHQIDIEIKNYKNQDSENPYTQRESASKNTRAPISKMRIDTASYTAEQDLIILALENKEYLEKFSGSGNQIVHSNYQIIWDALIDISYENPDLNDAHAKFMLLSSKLSSEASKELADLAIKLELGLHKEEPESRYKEIICRIKELQLKDAIEKLKQELNNLKDDDVWTLKARERRALEMELQALK